MSEYFSIVVSEEGLQKRLACEWLKGHKLFKEAVRTDKNRDIKINKEGKVIGAKPAKNDVEPPSSGSPNVFLPQIRCSSFSLLSCSFSLHPSLP